MIDHICEVHYRAAAIDGINAPGRTNVRRGACHA
jgi:hypothetical protein